MTANSVVRQNSLAHVPERMGAMAYYAEGQVHQLVEALEKNGFTAADITALGQNSNGVLTNLKMVLEGNAAIVRHCLKLALDKPFNPTEFIGEEWTIWRGPADGNGLEGKEDCVTEPEVVDFDEILIETYHFHGDETSVHGEEKMKRARASKNRQLGGRAFLALWNNWKACKAVGKPEDSILEKLRRANKIGNIIYFFGFTLRDGIGSRVALYLIFSGKWWGWVYDYLGKPWPDDILTACLSVVED